jgi:hypothetical protein
MDPMEAEATPLPKPETTPPVTKMNLVCLSATLAYPPKKHLILFEESTRKTTKSICIGREHTRYRSEWLFFMNMHSRGKPQPPSLVNRFSYLLVISMFLKTFLATDRRSWPQGRYQRQHEVFMPWLNKSSLARRSREQKNQRT